MDGKSKSESQRGYIFCQFKGHVCNQKGYFKWDNIFVKSNTVQNETVVGSSDIKVFAYTSKSEINSYSCCPQIHP